MTFREAAVVVGECDIVTYRHAPPGRNAVYLPDSRSLWDHLWETRATVVGVAHLHPGRGIEACYPSEEDRTTFRAVELGLGRTIEWWIVSANAFARWAFDAKGHLFPALLVANWHQQEPAWVQELRSLGEQEKENEDG